MDYAAAIKTLENLQSGRIHPQLDSIEKSAAQFGSPQNAFPSVHIAGTNGKGSVAAMLEAMLRANGYRTGLYTSPHIFDFAERITVNGEPIPHETVAGMVDEILPAVHEHNNTYFEAATLLAFLYFKRAEIDIAVIETGLGGRWDATSLVTPRLSIITQIALDHRHYLGDTLREVAAEKAGIIKNGVPCLIAPQHPEAGEVLRKHARSRDSNTVLMERDVSINIEKISLEGTTFGYRFGELHVDKIRMPLAGRHQALNAATALTAVSILAGYGFTADITKSIAGLAACRWRGRFEKIDDNPPFIVDVAHNPGAFMVLRDTFAELFEDRRMVLLFGVMKDKDYTEMLDIIVPLCSAVVGVPLPLPRALSPYALTGYFLRRQVPYFPCGSASDAVALARTVRKANEVIVAAGSHLTVEETALHWHER